MTGRSFLDDANKASCSSFRPRIQSSGGRNVFSLLSHREVCPRTKYLPRWNWGNSSKQEVDSSVGEVGRDARRGLLLWVEEQSLLRLSAKYCNLDPPPRSTIAVTFSPDGRTLASTHGDHTVKIIDCQNGRCLKEFSGHRRTPWVVRFHPKHPGIIASGSLDNEVRLWDANTSECIGYRNFNRPIASIAFHAEGEVIAVASGHKLFIWQYNRRNESASPSIVLKTRRSLRAVHFHPHGAPFLLTAEVNDLDPSDSRVTQATSAGSLHYPPPAIYMQNTTSEGPLMYSPLLHRRTDSLLRNRHIGPSQIDLGPSASVQFQANASATQHYNPMDTSSVDYNSHSLVEGTSTGHYSTGLQNSVGHTTTIDAMDTTEEQHVQGNQHIQGSRFANIWELPFLQGWLIGQSQAGIPPVIPFDSQRQGAAPVSISHNGSRSQPMVGGIQSDVAPSLAAELPCTVKLRIWPHDIRSPCDPLDAARCRLTIPHAVLCSEMGAHFSPCGRFLAVCVACVLPQMETDPGLLTHLHQDVLGTAGTSPTRHPISAHHMIYELRIYSLEEATFGKVLVSRAIRAAHCLTSIQFSPTSKHLLLAYGRRHSSLLKSIVVNTDASTSTSMYSVLEVYRVSDMELVSVLPSAEDEVNVACFHPSAGGGIVYGTKEGKLRLLQFDRSA